MDIRVALIGCGGWAQSTHVPYLQGRDDVELSILSGVYLEEEGYELAQRFGFKEYCHSWEEVAARPDIDAVIISTPHFLHSKQIDVFLRAGKHVHVDKPPTLTQQDLEGFKQFADEQELILSTHAQMKYMPGMQKVRTLLDTNFNTIFQVNAYIWQKLFGDFKGSWRAQPQFAGGGIMMDSGYHMIDTVHYLLRNRNSTAPNFLSHNGARASDTVGLLTYGLGDTIVSISSIRGAPKLTQGQRIEIFGDGGYIELKVAKKNDVPHSFITYQNMQGDMQTFEYSHNTEDYKFDPLQMFVDGIKHSNPYVLSEIKANVSISESVVDVLEKAYIKRRDPMTSNTDLPVVTVPAPHFEWGQPTENQRNALKSYIDQGGTMSIYGDDGVYQSLETWLADYYKTQYVILTNTGTSALNSAYVGLGIQEGDEVIVPTYTFLATVTPLLRLRAIPIFADADPETGNIDPNDIEHRITSKTKAIAVTHMWGVPCDMEAIMKIARKHGLKVVEDCSHAHFTKYKGKLLGTYGDVACLSIGAKKTLTSGEGGFMFTNDPEIYLRASLLGHFEVRAKNAIERVQKGGHSELYEKYQGLETGFGENYRMHPYSAVMAESLLQSGEIFDLIESRRESLKYFTERLLNEVTCIEAPVFDEDFYTGAMYGYKAKVRADLLTCTLEEAVATLRAQNVNIKMPDSTPLHEKPLFHKLETLDLGYHETMPIEGDFEGARQYMEGRVSLPTFTRGLEQDREVIDQYIEVFKAFEKKYLKK